MPSPARQPSRKSEEVYEGLRDLAITGRLAPQALPLQAIADAYHTSMQPVRDACVRLETEGFINYEAQRGYFAKPFTVEEQSQLLTVLLGLFSTALKTRSQLMPKAMFEEITHLKLEEAPTGSSTLGVAQYLASRIETMIDATLEASRNRVLHAFGRLTISRSSLVRRLDLEDRQAAEAAAQGLRKLAQAILDDQIDDAELMGRTIVQARSHRLGELVELANYRAERASPPWIEAQRATGS